MEGPECPACGVIYLRAEVRAAARQAEERELANQDAAWREAEDRRLALREALETHAAPTFVPPLVEAMPERVTPDLAFDDSDAADATFEAKLRVCVLPAALVLAWLAVHSPDFHALSRIFLTMPVHELGHAVSAWFCGFSAMPSLWVTPVSEERSPFMVVLVAGLLGTLVYQGWKRRRWTWVGVGTVLLAVQAVGTLALDLEQGRAMFTFGGDAGKMVLGAALMTTFYVSPDHYLRKHALRWGFVVIGAAAFMDGFEMWWAARTDVDRIPFGLIEGVGLSDPSRLVETYGWNVSRVIHRYVMVGVSCLVALGALYLGALWRVREVLRGGGGTGAA